MAANDLLMVAGATGIASVAPTGTTAPTTIASLSTPWVDLGAISDDGLVEAVSENKTTFTRWGSLAPNKTVLTSSAKTFQLTFWESNADVLGLYFRLGSAPTPTGATSEVQTVTISGTPTGGTFSLTLPGNGTASALTYNIATTALATALTTAFGMTVTVTGTPGASYVVTFAAAAGDVPQMTATSALTGGTTPGITVATTTPGVTGVLHISDSATPTPDYRSMVFDIVEGTNAVRIYLPQCEVTDRGNITYKSDTLIGYQVTMTAYPDENNSIGDRWYALDAFA